MKSTLALLCLIGSALFSQSASAGGGVAIFEDPLYAEFKKGDPKSGIANVDALLSRDDFDFGGVRRIETSSFRSFRDALVRSKVLVIGSLYIRKSQNEGLERAIDQDTVALLKDFVSTQGGSIVALSALPTRFSTVVLDKVLDPQLSLLDFLGFWPVTKTSQATFNVNSFVQFDRTLGDPQKLPIELTAHCENGDVSLGECLFTIAGQPNTAVTSNVVIDLTRSGAANPGSCLYGVRKNSLCAVYQVPVGKGFVYWLGWDWTNGRPVGKLDGGWSELLRTILSIATDEGSEK